jgi:hypothetical protein
MMCCLLTMALAGNAVAAGGAGWGMLRRPGLAMGLVVGAVLLIAGVSAIAIAPTVAEHAGHYAARAEAHQRSVLEEILAQPLCSGRVAANDEAKA